MSKSARQVGAGPRANAAAGAPSESLRRAESLAKGLFPHQVEGVAFLVRRRRAILADDMGLGKVPVLAISSRSSKMAMLIEPPPMW